MDDIETRIARSFNAQRMMNTLGARLARVADGEVHIELPFSAALTQQHGYLHAGATTTIVDNACGYAALTKAPAGSEVVSVEFKINFNRPALGERFVAVGKVQSAGRTLMVCSGEVFAYTGGDSKLVALMQATIMVVPSP